MRLGFAMLAAVSMIAIAMPPGMSTHPFFYGVSSYMPGNGYDAPIFRQFAFVEGRVTQYHVLTPETFLMDAHQARVYQFPLCSTLKPVFEKHHSTPGDGGFQGDHDTPTRQITDVVLSTGCSVQPTSEAQVLSLALPGAVVPRGMFVNAPIVPAQIADLTDAQLFNSPPYRPRVEGWQEGVRVKFITYEASWYPTWVGTNFPDSDGDVFVISYSPTFRHNFTILNIAAGTPLDPTSFDKYSPMWRANCIVDAQNQKCGISVNAAIPGYTQCKAVAECLQMVNAVTGQRVVQTVPNTFTHINCPMVAVDIFGPNGSPDNYIDPSEELLFPDLWTNGPVLV